MILNPQEKQQILVSLSRGLRCTTTNPKDAILKAEYTLGTRKKSPV